MSDAIKYNEKVLGWIHSYTGDDTSKFNIVMEGFGSLEIMCKGSDEEILNIGEMPSLTFKEFKDQIISKTKRIYLSDHEYNIDFHPIPAKKRE
ncbi:MAG: hypothetical protein AABW50_00610 [Nanoarchaeota archaeon]